MKKKPTIVLAFGTFDLLHPGHIAYLKQAKQHGDMLAVVVSRDETVKRIKGRNPLLAQEDRLLMVQSLSIVDRALLGSSSGQFDVIAKLLPSCICLGYDHAISPRQLARELEKRDLFVPRILRMKSYRPKKYKSHLLGKK